MGRKDIITKEYMEDTEVFADVFNHMIYQGEKVIDPKNLKELDTASVVIPYGADGAEVPYQKYRDVFKILCAMKDENAVYLLLGVENQSNVHYAMPVKNMVYDSLEYAAQVQKAESSHREALRKKNPKEKKPDPAEFLSGFYKEDRLLPIITVVVYFGADNWEAPRSLHEMLAVQDEKILSLVPDYRINLIAPGEMSEEELEHFTSNFREVMQFIKYSEDAEKLERLVKANAAFATVDRKAVRVMEEMTGMKIEKEARGEKVNVCKGILGIEEKGRAAGREEGREEGRAEGRAEGVSAGIQREQKLTRSLLRDNRLDDLKRALDDPAFRQKLCEEYGID